MVRVVFACATGMSVSLFLEHLQLEIKEKDLNDVILVDALPYSQVVDFNEEIDVLVLAPQISHLFNFYKSKFQCCNVKILKLSPKDLAYMDSSSILSKIIEIKEDKINGI